MTVVLWDINVKKRQESGTIQRTGDTDSRMLDLDKYYEIARRCIGAFASGSVAKAMLRSEDAISFVAEHLIYATCRWTSEGGRTLHSYLNQCAIWSIQRWILLSKKAGCNGVMSLNYETQAGEGQFGDLVPDNKATTPLSEICREEDLSAIRLAMDGLTEKQRRCIELIYIEGYSGADAARELDVSRQAVEQCAAKALGIIRNSVL